MSNCYKKLKKHPNRNLYTFCNIQCVQLQLSYMFQKQNATNPLTNSNVEVLEKIEEAIEQD